MFVMDIPGKFSVILLDRTSEAEGAVDCTAEYVLSFVRKAIPVIPTDSA